MTNEHAMGAVLGALVGDAAGATLEFLGRKPTPAEVERALTMPGGGCWRVGPGQITDDGELTLCLARGLVEQPGSPLEATARWYRRWYESPPFDIGNTTANALSARPGPGALSTAMTEAAADKNQGSKANGSLMRCTPLAVWGHRLSTKELVAAARADSALTHSNRSCGDAVATYVLAVAALVRGGGRQEAYSLASGWARQHANAEVNEWLDLVEADVVVPCEPMMGFAKIAFTHAFRHLIRGTDYVEALRQTLAGGGDTDTNACIVGGLVGAAVGVSGIPTTQQEGVLQRDHTVGRIRPGFCQPDDLRELVAALLEAQPGVESEGRQTLAVADLHGHVDHLNALLNWADAKLGDYDLVLLGDYCDNGPDTPALLDRLIELRSERGDAFTAILGNHDLACLRALESDDWYHRWCGLYQNAGLGTPTQYGANNPDEFRRAFPEVHRAFLASLPWVHEAPGYVFVHAGMEQGPLQPQIEGLIRQELPTEPLFMPQRLRDKGLSKVADPSWSATVVSAHNKHLRSAVFSGPNRLCLRAEVDATSVLHAVVLPTGQLVTVGPDTTVNAEE
jgi:ADP-ribosyl-[dinitrogen reductase] hydrolase